MELEELKSNWFEMSQQLEKQKIMTNEVIMKLASQRSNSIFQPILNFEKLGIAVSSVMLLYIFASFEKLNNWLSLTGGIITSIILVIGLMLSVVLINKIQNVDFVTKNYRQTILDVKKIKKFQYYMKWSSAILAPFLAISILPTFADIWLDKSLLIDLEEYWESLIPCILLIPILWYFTGRFYSRKMKEINKMIKEFYQ